MIRKDKAHLIYFKLDICKHISQINVNPICKPIIKIQNQGDGEMAQW